MSMDKSPVYSFHEDSAPRKTARRQWSQVYVRRKMDKKSIWEGSRNISIAMC
ncbi:12508_t:CDS:2 [Rhizophagus irregularis]|nr:12508_t:CDS:2 [Rhizophagus irregularis]